MLKVKSHKSYDSNIRNIILLYMVAWFVFTAIVISWFAEKISIHPAWLALPTFIITGILIIRTLLKAKKTFKCPDCNSEIVSPLENSEESGEAILYQCQQCETLWHVGETSSSW